MMRMHSPALCLPARCSEDFARVWEIADTSQYAAAATLDDQIHPGL